MLRYYTIIVSLLSMVFLISCERSYLEPDPEEDGFQYYPLEIKNYWVYDVTRIEHTMMDGVDTSRFQVKEVVADTFYDISGELNYRLEIYSRPLAGESWPTIPDSVWTVRYNNKQQLVRTENNIPYVVMLSRISNLMSWNRNAWNTLEKEESFITNLPKPMEVNGKNYEKTLKVVQDGYMDQGKLVEADSNIIYYRRQYEHYAYKVGVIDQVDIDIKYAQRNGMPVFPPQVDAGSKEYYKKLVDYGKL